MFANGFCATLDACVLAKALERDLILSLRACELFRVAWSPKILEETKGAIEKMTRGTYNDASQRAIRVVEAMKRAFDDASFNDYENRMPAVPDQIDVKDRHVVAVALASQSNVIVTENLKDFPPNSLAPYNIETKSIDLFIADAIHLDPRLALEGIDEMLARLKRPPIDRNDLLARLEAKRLVETANALSELL